MLLIIYHFDEGNNVTTGSFPSASLRMILHGRGFLCKGVISIDNQSALRIMLFFSSVWRITDKLNLYRAISFLIRSKDFIFIIK